MPKIPEASPVSTQNLYLGLNLVTIQVSLGPLLLFTIPSWETCDCLLVGLILMFLNPPLIIVLMVEGVNCY